MDKVKPMLAFLMNASSVERFPKEDITMPTVPVAQAKKPMMGIQQVMMEISPKMWPARAKLFHGPLRWGWGVHSATS